MTQGWYKKEVFEELMKRSLIAIACLLSLAALADEIEEDHVYFSQSLSFKVGRWTVQRHQLRVECDISNDCYYVTRPCEMLSITKSDHTASKVLLKVSFGTGENRSNRSMYLSRRMPKGIDVYSDQEECRVALNAKKKKKKKKKGE